MTLLALIPARGGSVAIPRKNIRMLCGKPLLQWSIDAALESKSVDKVVVSTEDSEIAAIARACGAEVPFMRPQEFSTNFSSGLAPVIHALEQLPEITNILVLQPTSPLRTSEDIEAIINLRNKTGSESAVSLTNCAKHPAWMYEISENHYLSPILPYNDVETRQQLPTTYVLNGALYLASREYILRERSFIGKDTVGYFMPQNRSIDIDTPLEFEMAKFLMRQALK